MELGGSESDSEVEEETSDSEEQSDSGEESEITEQNLKLPGHKSVTKKASIQVVDQHGE